ncbi:MAG: FG-GAP repeat protein, partial [Thermoplasmata archaeon]
ISHEGASDSAYSSDFGVDSNGNLIVVWQNNRDEGLNNFSIYANKYTEGDITGKAYIYYGGSSVDDTPDVNLTGEAEGDKFGYSVSYAGDMDEDGAPDVIIGVPFWDNGATTDCGQILVFRGGSSMDTTADYVHNGTQANEHFGWSVSLALKMDGGSNNMVVVGGPHYDGSTDIGEAEILYIPEYTTIIMPFVGTIILFAIYRRKRKKGGGR